MDCSPRKRRVWEKGTFTPRGKIFDFPSRGKIDLNPFFASKDVWGKGFQTVFSKRCFSDSSPRLAAEVNSLSFLSLFFFWKIARKTTKKTRIFIPAEPLKTLETKGKAFKKTEFLAGEKNKEFQKHKERKDRAHSEGQRMPENTGVFNVCRWLQALRAICD